MERPAIHVRLFLVLAMLAQVLAPGLQAWHLEEHHHHDGHEACLATTQAGEPDGADHEHDEICALCSTIAAARYPFVPYDGPVVSVSGLDRNWIPVQTASVHPNSVDLTAGSPRGPPA